MQDRVSIHKLFLPGGVICLALGLWGLSNYFRLKGPANDQLHEVLLRDVTQVTAESEIPGSLRIDNIWLQTSNGAKIRYRSRFPYSSEIRRLDTNYGLLVDSTNIVWAIKTSDGEVRSRAYFEEYNIEAKEVGKFCGSFLGAFGALLLFGYIYTERHWRTATAEARAKLEVDSHRLRLFLMTLGYLILYGTLIGPWLMRYLPKYVVSLLWVLSAGALFSLFSRKQQPTP